MLKIVGLQLELRDGKKKENLMKALNILKAVADKEREVDFFCLPELFDTGFDYTHLNLIAEEIPGETVNALSNFAEEFGSYVIAGIAEKYEGKIFDSAVLIGPQGKVLCVYRKTHLFQEEKDHFSSGDTLFVVNIGKYRVGLQICYEIRFPEISRALTLNGAKIIFSLAAFPLERVDHFMLLAKARAVENQVFHVAVNRVGPGEDKVYGGGSLIVNPLGDVIAGAGRIENVMVGVIDLDLIDDVRRKITVLSDRREEVYKRVKVVHSNF